MCLIVHKIFKVPVQNKTVFIYLIFIFLLNFWVIFKWTWNISEIMDNEVSIRNVNICRFYKIYVWINKKHLKKFGRELFIVKKVIFSFCHFKSLLLIYIQKKYIQNVSPFLADGIFSGDKGGSRDWQKKWIVTYNLII